MTRLVLALVLIAFTAPGCLGSESQPSGRVSVVVTLAAGTSHPATHRYELRCGPTGGTMPGPGTACSALADYIHHRDDPGRICIGPTPRIPNTILAGRFAGRRLRIEITPGSWCGASNSVMRDYWILSAFPCSTLVFRYSNQHPYSRGIAPPRCLSGSDSR
jgi:hypothetical protein